jgi:hypothetical protein
MENEDNGMSQGGVVLVNSVTVIADSFEPDEPETEISEEV